MSQAFKDRPLNADELEGLRLLLSTFRDGGGQQTMKSGGSMPGFRDFERSLAAVLYAVAPENKGIFDVHVASNPRPFGISCKMTATQPAGSRSSFMELSNSAKKFNDELDRLGIDWVMEPVDAGSAVIELVESWHREEGAALDLSASRYAVLSHDRRWQRFQVLCFPLDLKMADPVREVDWAVEGASLNWYVELPTRRHRLWQWYRNSGGQLKYYPPLRWALWGTEEFELEQPPSASLRSRATAYFPDLWPRPLGERPERPETPTV